MTLSCAPLHPQAYRQTQGLLHTITRYKASNILEKIKYRKNVHIPRPLSPDIQLRKKPEKLKYNYQHITVKVDVPQK